MENRQTIEKQHEAYVEQYRKDCMKIEQQQEDVRETKKLLERVEQQVYEDRNRINALLEKYINTNNGSLAKLAGAQLEEVREAGYRVETRFAEEFDSLDMQKRKLEQDYDDRRDKYRADTQKPKQGSPV